MSEISETEKPIADALKAVRDRQKVYGPPKENFQRHADLVNAHFGTQYSAADMAMINLLGKIARLGESPAHFDSIVDICGYAGCYWEAQT